MIIQVLRQNAYGTAIIWQVYILEIVQYLGPVS